MNWFACEMHCHTLNSDGDFTVEELLTTAKEYELDGIALTDHNTTAGHRAVTAELQKNTVSVLLGIEWTTYFGHMLVTGCEKFVDWRDAVPDNIDEKTDEIKKYNGMVGIAHPFELGSPMCTGGFWEYNVHKWENIDYIEVWSKPFPASKSANERAMMMWTSLLDRGYRLAATYGKDWHRLSPEEVPSACTYIGTECETLTGKEIKNAVLNGRTAVAMGPRVLMSAKQGSNEFNLGGCLKAGENTEFTIEVNETVRRNMWEKFNFSVETVRLVGVGGKTVCEIKYDGNNVTFNLTAKKGWYRAEIWGTAADLPCELGFTSPIYCE